MRNLKITLMLLALVGLLAFAGCGGDDDGDSSGTTATDSTTATDTTATDSTSTDSAGGEYGSELSTILTEFGASFADIGSEIQGSQNPDDYVAAFDDFESEIDSTISDIETLDTPEEAQQGQDDLVSALEGFRDGIAAFGDELEGGDPAAIQSALTQFQKEATTFQKDATAALTDLSEAGVSVAGAPGLGG